MEVWGKFSKSFSFAPSKREGVVTLVDREGGKRGEKDGKKKDGNGMVQKISGQMAG
jgi:hypothetical protein